MAEKYFMAKEMRKDEPKILLPDIKKVEIL